MANNGHVDEYADFRPAAPAQNVLDEVRDGVWLMLQRQAAVDEAEAKLKLAKASLNKVKYEDLPTLMQKLGELTELDLKMPNGQVYHIKREEKVHAKLSEGQADKVFAWLKEHNYSHFISNNVVIPFTKGQEAELKKLEQYLDALPENDKVQYKCLESIHPSTYTALCTRLKKQLGEAVDDKVFGIHVLKQVTAEARDAG